MGSHKYSSLLVCLFVYYESTHLNVPALCMNSLHTKVVSFNSGRFDVKASLLNKSEQKLKLNLHVGS